MVSPFSLARLRLAFSISLEVVGKTEVESLAGWVVPVFCVGVSGFEVVVFAIEMVESGAHWGRRRARRGLPDRRTSAAAEASSLSKRGLPDRSNAREGLLRDDVPDVPPRR